MLRGVSTPAKTHFQAYWLRTLATLPGVDDKVVYRNLATVPGRTSDGRKRGKGGEGG